jgi:hypothetical protein
VRSVGYGVAVMPIMYRTDATYERLFKQPLRETAREGTPSVSAYA